VKIPSTCTYQASKNWKRNRSGRKHDLPSPTLDVVWIINLGIGGPSLASFSLINFKTLSEQPFTAPEV